MRVKFAVGRLAVYAICKCGVLVGQKCLNVVMRLILMTLLQTTFEIYWEISILKRHFSFDWRFPNCIENHSVATSVAAHIPSYFRKILIKNGCVSSECYFTKKRARHFPVIKRVRPAGVVRRGNYRIRVCNFATYCPFVNTRGGVILWRGWHFWAKP